MPETTYNALKRDVALIKLYNEGRLPFREIDLSRGAIEYAIRCGFCRIAAKRAGIVVLTPKGWKRAHGIIQMVKAVNRRLKEVLT